MNVHVHFARIELDEEERDRVLPAHERRMMTFTQRAGDDGALDGATIDEDKLLRARLPADARTADVAEATDAAAFRTR